MLFVYSGQLKLKFEFVSYQEKVMNQYKQLSKDNQQLILYKKVISKQERCSKALEDALEDEEDWRREQNYQLENTDVPRTERGRGTFI